jgi:hypothetical protein
MKIRTSCKNSTAVASVRIGKSSVVNFIISFGVLCCVRGRERLEMLSLYTIYTKQHEKILIYSDWGGGESRENCSCWTQYCCLMAVLLTIAARLQTTSAVSVQYIMLPYLLACLSGALATQQRSETVHNDRRLRAPLMANWLLLDWRVTRSIPPTHPPSLQLEPRASATERGRRNVTETKGECRLTLRRG